MTKGPSFRGLGALFLEGARSVLRDRPLGGLAVFGVAYALSLPTLPLPFHQGAQTLFTSYATANQLLLLLAAMAIAMRRRDQQHLRQAWPLDPALALGARSLGVGAALGGAMALLTGLEWVVAVARDQATVQPVDAEPYALGGAYGFMALRAGAQAALLSVWALALALHWGSFGAPLALLAVVAASHAVMILPPSTSWLEGPAWILPDLGATDLAHLLDENIPWGGLMGLTLYLLAHVAFVAVASGIFTRCRHGSLDAIDPPFRSD